MKMTESMQVYDQNAYPWNHAVGPHGNMGNISPFFVSLDCNKYGIAYLMMTLRNAGTDHRKFMQMIILIWKLNLKSFANKTHSLLKGVDIYEKYASV